MADWQCAAIGAFVLWGRWSAGSGSLKFIIPLAEFFEELGIPRPWRYLLELTIFLALGVFMAIQIVGAQTCKEAFLAGVGWTGLASQVRPKKPSEKQKR